MTFGKMRKKPELARITPKTYATLVDISILLAGESNNANKARPTAYVSNNTTPINITVFLFSRSFIEYNIIGELINPLAARHIPLQKLFVLVWRIVGTESDE